MNLYLIGYRGSGKTSVAPHLGKILDRQWVDTDKQIEVATGQTIAEVFDAEGETGFRQWETTVIQAYANQTNLIVALGGGAPTIKENRTLMKESGKTVLLTADPKVLWDRISSDSASEQTRPRLTDLDGFAEVQKLLTQRAEIYADCADYTIDTSQMAPELVAADIANWFDPVDR